MAKKRAPQLALPITVAVCEPGPEAPVPDWRPEVPIAEDHYAGPPLPEPKKKRVLVRDDRPLCPGCKSPSGSAVDHPGIPNDDTLMCLNCMGLWQGSPPELAQARRADRAEERHERDEDREQVQRSQRRRVAILTKRTHLVEVLKPGKFRGLCGVSIDDPSGRNFLVEYVFASDLSGGHICPPTCPGCVAEAPPAWVERLKEINRG